MTAEMTKEQDTSFLPSKNLTMPVIRRSRSLSELPGSIRIPILRRTDSDRMRARLEASMQGLDELKLLKEQQRKIIDDAMTSSLQRTGRSNTQQNLQRRMSVSSLRSSSTSLAKICEEVSENENGGSVIGNSNNNRGSCISNNSSWTSQRRHSFAQSQNSRSRRPLSLADSDLLEQELYNEDERLKKHHSWTSLMHSFYGSQPQALESTRSTECLRRSRSDDIPVHNPSGKLGRSQSFSVASDNSSLHFQFPREAKSYNSENIEPKLRRASIQCEAVLSGASVDSKQRGLFKDVDLNSLRGNFPNPLRAVLMQYGNSQPPREVQKRNTSDQREADSQSSAKVPNSKKSESNPVYDKYKQLNGTHCDNIQNSTGDRPKNNKNYDARNNTNKESRSTHNHRGSSETIGGSSRASLSNKDLSSKTLISENKDLSSKTLISDHRDRNMNNIGRRLSVPATITRCDAINNNTRLNPTASSDSINISETRPSLSLDNVSSITKTDGSRAPTATATDNAVHVSGSSESEHSRNNNDNNNVCSAAVTDCNHAVNKGQGCLNATPVCSTSYRFVKLIESIPVQSPASPPLTVSVISKRKPEDDTNLDISSYSDIGSSSTDHNISISSSNDNASCNRKMLSIASDEGYVTSPPSSPRGHNRHGNSIVSNGSWISADLDETSGFESISTAICENTESTGDNINFSSVPEPIVCSTPKVVSSQIDPENLENKSKLPTIDAHDISKTRPFRQTAV